MEEIVIKALKTVQDEHGIQPNGVTTETVIYGEKDSLTSLQLVRLVVEIEELVETELGKQITIANEKALSMKNSPFRTVNTLSDFINQLINE